MAQRDPTKSKRRKQPPRDAPTASESARTGQGSFGLLAPKVEPARTAGLLAPSVPLAAPVSSANRASMGVAPENSQAGTAGEAQNRPVSSRSKQTNTDIRDIELRDLESPLKIVGRIQLGETVRLSPQAVRSLTDEELGSMETRLSDVIWTERNALSGFNERNRALREDLGEISKEEELRRQEANRNAAMKTVEITVDPSFDKPKKFLRKIIPPSAAFALERFKEFGEAKALFDKGMVTLGTVTSQEADRKEFERRIGNLGSQLQAIQAEQKRRESQLNKRSPVPPGL